MVLFLFSFKDITDTHGKGHHSGKKDGRLPAPFSYLLTLSMIYEQAVRRPPAFIFSAHSCSSLSHSSRQSCLGRDSFTELTHFFFCTGESQWGGDVPSSGTWSQSAANTAHLSIGNKHFQAFKQQHSITHHVFLLLLSFIYDALIWITVWQKTRSTGGRAAPASARPGNAVVPCCTSWPASSPGEAKERSTWVGWALFFLSTDPQILLCTFLFTLQEEKKGVTQTCSALNLQFELLMLISKRWGFKKTIWGKSWPTFPECVAYLTRKLVFYFRAFEWIKSLCGGIVGAFKLANSKVKVAAMVGNVLVFCFFFKGETDLLLSSNSGTGYLNVWRFWSFRISLRCLMHRLLPIYLYQFYTFFSPLSSSLR